GRYSANPQVGSRPPSESRPPARPLRSPGIAATTEDMSVDRFAHPALVIVDMQNDFARVGAPREVRESRPTIAVHQRLLAACRARGVPVIYTKFVAGPERTPIWEWAPQLAAPVWCGWHGL